MILKAKESQHSVRYFNVVDRKSNISKGINNKTKALTFHKITQKRGKNRDHSTTQKRDPNGRK